MSSRGSRKNDLSAQETLKLAQGKSGQVRMEEKSKLFGRMSYNSRFVITSRDTMFIFTKDTASKPRERIRLMGYNRVTRIDSSDLEYRFSIVPGLDDEELKPIKIQCCSERDRLEWMEAIKQLLHIANGITESQESMLFRRRRFDDSLNGYGTLSEDEYAWLEQPVFETNQSEGSANPASPQDNSDSDSDAADSGVGSRPMSNEMQNSFSHMPPAPLPANQMRAESRRHATTQSWPQKSSPPPPCPGRSVKSEYVNMRQQDDHQDDEYIYPPSLFEQCSVVHMSESREELLRRLGERSEGTYFIRKSRNDNSFVLSIHCGKIGARELKIRQFDDKFTIDPKKMFDSIEDFLKFYSVYKVPGANITLKRGIFYFAEAAINSEEEEEDEEDPYSQAG